MLHIIGRYKMNEQDISVLIYKMSSAIVTYINHELNAYHLTFQQFSILRYISQQDDEVIGKDICQFLGVSHPTAVGLTSRMVKNNLLIASISSNDRRQTAFCLSQYGQEILTQTQSLIDQVETQIADGLGENSETFKQCLLSLEEIF